MLQYYIQQAEKKLREGKQKEQVRGEVYTQNPGHSVLPRYLKLAINLSLNFLASQPKNYKTHRPNLYTHKIYANDFLVMRPDRIFFC